MEQVTKKTLRDVIVEELRNQQQDLGCLDLYNEDDDTIEVDGVLELNKLCDSISKFVVNN